MLQPILCFWDLTNGEECGIIKIRYCDEWENPISTDESSDSEVGEINPFRYKSYYYDSETRLYYLRSRSYDPVVGRFLNADSTDYLGTTQTLLSYNLFAYCENNSVNLDDKYGKLAIASVFAKIILSIVIGIFSQMFFDLILQLFDKNHTPRGVDYLASIASCVAMFFVSQSNVINWLISAIPWITKAIGGLFVKTDWEVIIIEIGFWIVSNLISKVLGRNKLKKINKILRKYKNNGYLILKNKFKLNIKYEFLGFKFNIVLFFSNSSLQTFISIIKGDMNKYI